MLFQTSSKDNGAVESDWWLARFDTATGAGIGAYRLGGGMNRENPPDFQVGAAVHTPAGETLVVGYGGFAYGPALIRIGTTAGGTREGDYLTPPFKFNTCKDRDNDGKLKTYAGIDRYGAFPWVGDLQHAPVDSAEEEALLAGAEDEAITQFRMLRDTGGNLAFIGLPFGIALSADGYVWVSGPIQGGGGNYMLRLLKLRPGDLSTDAVIDTGIAVLYNSDPYGPQSLPGSADDLIISRTTQETVAGAWGHFGPLSGTPITSQGGAESPSTPQARILPAFAVNPRNGHIWYMALDALTRVNPGSQWQIDPCSIAGVSLRDGPLLVDTSDDVWVAPFSGGPKVARISANCELLGTFDACIPNRPSSLALDRERRIWVSTFTDFNQRLVRIDPRKGPQSTDPNKRLGAVDLVSDLPINYRGFFYFCPDTIQQRGESVGSWTAVHDSTVANCSWGTASWTASVPARAKLTVEVRAAASRIGLAGEPWVPVQTSGGDFNLTGQWLEVRVSFDRGSAGSSPILEEVTVRPRNSSVVLPTVGLLAVDDQFATFKNSPAQFSVLDNDAQGQGLVLQSVSPPRHGTANVSGSMVQYTPAAEFFGEDRFVYTVSGPNGLLDRALVKVNVSPSSAAPADVTGGCASPVLNNHAPEAFRDSVSMLGFTTSPGEPITINVLANDSDPEGDAIALVDDLPRRTGFGIVRKSGNSLIYSPSAGAYGTDVFSYTIHDIHGAEASGTVVVNVVPVLPPDVSIAAPAAGTVTAPITISATVTPQQVDLSVLRNGVYDGFSSMHDFGDPGAPLPSTFRPKIVRVEFFAGPKKLGEGTLTAGSWNYTWQLVPSGTHKLTAVATDELGSVGISPEVLVTVVGTSGNTPTATIVRFDPADVQTVQADPTDLGAYVRRPVVNVGRPRVRGTVYDQDSTPAQIYYQLLLYRSDRTLVANVTPNAQDGYSTIARDNQTEREIATIDLTSFANGSYELELRAFDGTVEYIAPRYPFVLRTGLKLGQFVFSEQDTVAATPSLPLTIVRSYDSSKAWDGDFGFGWTYAINDLDAEINEQRTEAVDAFTDESFDMRVGGGWDVTLTLPDGRRTTFTARFAASGYPDAYSLIWDAEPGVTATLQTISPGNSQNLGDNTVLALSSRLTYWAAGGPACPYENYDLAKLDMKLQDGTIYHLQRQDFGIHDVEIEPGKYIHPHSRGKLRVTEVDKPNGEKLIITPNGVTHKIHDQVTRSLVFERGIGNRIIAIRDDQGPTSPPLVRYEYDGLGNLVRVHKLVNRDTQTYETTKYIYDESGPFAHYIKSIVDPRGVELARNEYYPDGKLHTIKDPDQRVTTFTYDYAGPFETGGRAVARELITDNEGFATTHETDAQGNIVLTKDAQNHYTERWFDSKNNLSTETIKPTYGASGLTTGYTYTYGGATGNELTSRTVQSPGGVSTREDMDSGAQNQVQFSVDANHYINGPAKGASFYTEYEYDKSDTDGDGKTGLLLKTWAKGTEAPLPANPLTENRYYKPNDPAPAGLLKESYDVFLNRTTYKYYTGVLGDGTPDPDGRSGDLKQVIQAQFDGGTAYTELSSTVYKYDTVTGNRKEEIRQKRVTGVWTDYASTKFNYDQRGRLLKTTDALNGTTITTYGSSGQPASSTDRYGATTKYTYDVMGRLVKTEYPDRSIARSATYYAHCPDPNNSNDPILRHVVQEDRHFDGEPVSGSRAIYDELGRAMRTERVKDVQITLETSGEIGTSMFASATVVSSTETKYDYAGRIDMTRDANNRWTKYEYDDKGRQWRVRAFVDSTGSDIPDTTINSIMDYDLNGNQQWVLDPTQFEAIKTALPSPATPTSWRSHIANEQGRLTISTYDHFNRVTRVDSPSKGPDDGLIVATAATQSKYDDGGRRWLQVDADGKATAYVYDGLGRLTWVITDVKPGAESIPNPLPANWPTWSERQADSTATHYTYDDLGQMETQTDGKGRTTIFEYDPLGRSIARTLPGNVLHPDSTETAARETWAYDYSSLPEGPKVNKVRHLDLNGRYTLTTYDLSGRVIDRRPDGRETWANSLPAGGDVPVSIFYNGAGQRASMADAGGETHYAYDDQNRLRIKQSAQGILYYDYDAAGNVKEISARYSYNFGASSDTHYDEGRRSPATTRPEGAHMSYEYDARNRLWKAYSDPERGVLVATYAYGAGGELRSVAYGNGTTTAYDYNARYQLRRVRSAQTSAAATLIANFDYDEAGTAATAGTMRGTWDAHLLSPSGRRNRLTETVRSISKTTDFTYDNLNRLSVETAGGSSVTYDAGPGYETSGYDEVGNRGSRSITGAGFPGVDPQTSLGYDKNDRDDNDSDPNTPSTLFDANGNRISYDGWVYSYDFENHLIGAFKDRTVITMAYDGDGNRVSKTVNGLTTSYLVDDRNPTGYSQVLEEQSSPGVDPQVTYLFALDLLSQTQPDTINESITHYYGYDGQGTVRYLTSGTPPAAITDTYSYDAFGILIDEWHDGTGTPDHYLYTGEQWDPDLAMYYLRARSYNPQIGRFWTMDTFKGFQEDPLSLHNYLYCHDNPLNRTDPTGRLADNISFLITDFINTTLEAAPKPVQAAAAHVAKRQLIRSIANLVIPTSAMLFLQGDEPQDQIPRMIYTISEFPTIAPKIAQLQFTHPGWHLLHYIGPLDALSDTQRNLAFKKVRGKDPGPGNWWDEYPFATTFEGGSAADVQPAPEAEQRKQGGKHSSFYQRNHMLMGDPFYVEVIP